MGIAALQYEVDPAGALGSLADVGGEVVARVAARSATVSLPPLRRFFPSTKASSC